MPYVFLNGKFLDASQAHISIFDRSYLYGAGVFETLRAYGGKPAFADRHYERLARNADALRLSIPFNQKEWSQILAELLARNNLTDTTLRTTVSDNTSIFCRPIDITPQLYISGAKVLLLDNPRNNDVVAAGIKSTSYVIKMLARQKATEAGAFDAVLKNQQNDWVEGSKTNFFIVRQGTVLTAPLTAGLLPGVTRDVVLEILREGSFSWKEALLTDADLKTADEIFLTGSSTEVMPVSCLTGCLERTLPVGPITQRLLQLYRKKITLQ